MKWLLGLGKDRGFAFVFELMLSCRGSFILFAPVGVSTVGVALCCQVGTRRWMSEMLMFKLFAVVTLSICVG